MKSLPTSIDTKMATCVLAGNRSSSSSTSRSRLSRMTSALASWMRSSRLAAPLAGVGVAAAGTGVVWAHVAGSSAASDRKPASSRLRHRFDIRHSFISEIDREEELPDRRVVRVQAAGAHVREIAVIRPDEFECAVQADLVLAGDAGPGIGRLHADGRV